MNNLNMIGEYVVFYTELETDNINNIVRSKLKNKTVPNNLKEKFLSEYGKKVKEMTITGEEIDSFLKRNK